MSDVDDNGFKSMTVAEALSFFGTKDEMHKSILRNQIFIPPLKDAFVSEDFMWGVITEKYWLPPVEYVHYRNCADPPPKQLLLKMLKDTADKAVNNLKGGQAEKDAFNRTMERIYKIPPCTSYLVLFLATLNDKHAIFSKDYIKPVSTEQVSQEIQDSVIKTRENSFKNLPRKRTNKSMLRFKNPNRIEQRVKKLAWKAERLQSRLNRVHTLQNSASKTSAESPSKMTEPGQALMESPLRMPFTP